ncbi:MAG: type II secretion system ATPase GspE [Nitrospinaceae bacterium]|nr:type II secretion system ATPase GspE [Nitrospinaceae bacterium]MBT3432846.1 type II secretion system ATPase GspE [Nitrospinaceae bacterium]MBT4430452.1 type II secretion system ATPase GspE [Nitrospinaceae bacterium]MBT5366497.1 type II secretion system ATPase GspE [Nitrospinaceae bacterium]MBT5948779.1 type II secretion system ATPase GspE [Nitrospinaceae bacterium]
MKGIPVTDDSRPLGEWLIEHTELSVHQLEASLAEEEGGSRALADILVEKGFVSEREIIEANSFLFDIPFLDDFNLSEVDPELLAKLPVPFLLRHKVIPVRQEQGRILVATVNPIDLAPVDSLGTLLGVRAEPVLAPERAIQMAIQSLYEREEHSAQAMMHELGGEESIDIADGGRLDEELDLSHEAPVIRLVNRVIHQAVRDRASDIHWEPFEKEMKIRLRVDGILHDILRIEKMNQMAVISRLKVMAGMDIAERRLPQDGRIQRKVSGRDIDMRVSSVPTVHGERIVLRLLDRSSILLDLEDIGFSADQFQIFSRLIRLSNGIVLVTGPTGSGKTTTLYAAIQKLRSSETNILTIEDPVEYQLDGVGQMQVAVKSGFSFADGLRSTLRQDPDIILVGEIRDKETAEVAIHASLTGHLVFSTLHTNDSVGAVTRLVEMGIEPFLISSSLVGVMAQRLVRKICSHCAEPKNFDSALLREVGLLGEDLSTAPPNLTHGKGCPVCYHTGYRGRSGIFEVLEVNEEMRELMNSRNDATALKAAARRNGMRTLLEDGGLKVAAGKTTPEEVLRIVQA